MNKLIELKQVEKIFYTADQKIQALAKINLTIEAGEIFCILGPSGCGKSTLLRCIAGFEEVTAGEILIDKHRVSKPGPDRIMVFQGFDQLLPWKTVLENVAYPLTVNGQHKIKESREIAKDYLWLVGLTEFINNYPHQLSGGMKQRVAIARALALKPQVLLMDEPFGSLDAQTRSVLQKELIRIWGQVKTTIVFITHSIEEAIILGDKVAVMGKGSGTIKEVINNDLIRPRSFSSTGFKELWNKINNLLEY